MKIGGNLSGFSISAEGLSVQRKKMNIIAENIANADTVKNEMGEPYQKKFLKIVSNNEKIFKSSDTSSKVTLISSNEKHISNPVSEIKIKEKGAGIGSEELTDEKQGELVYIPEHPYANEDGYVQMTNVNIITEMTDMIAATRSYEANLTALNASKQIAKDSLEI